MKNIYLVLYLQFNLYSNSNLKAMKNYFILVLFLCTIISSNAQLSTYDISTYARPDLVRQTMSITPSFSSRGFYFDENYYENTFTNVEKNWTSISLGMSIDHTKFVNTAETQTFIRNAANISGAYKPGLINASGIFPFPSSGAQSIDFRIIGDYARNYSRKKFKENQKFWEIDYTINGGIIYNTFDVVAPSVTHTINTDPFAGISIYRGKGRIELVNDAWHAQTILEMLQTNNSLERDPSHEEIDKLAAKISEIKNIRNTDFRLEGIAEYETLVQYFLENDLVDKEDYRFFALLNDAWEYESFLTRWSGTEFKYGLEINSVFRYFANNTFNIKTFLFTLPKLSFHYNRYKPISTNFQFNNRNSIDFSLIGQDQLSGNFTYGSRSYAASLSSIWEYQYLPNQRTNYTLGLQLHSSYFNSNGIYESESWTSNLSLNFAYKRYLSPRLSISLSASLAAYNRAINLPYNGITHNLFFRTSYRLY